MALPKWAEAKSLQNNLYSELLSPQIYDKLLNVMKKILGIDLGTNSLGWALIEENTKLIDGGVIIFPRGNQQDPKSGKETSFAQNRTIFRGARRLLFRRKLRRQRLLELAKKYFNLSPEDIYTDTDPNTIYRLRSEGLERLLTEKELFRICLYFAKKRGFLSNRKDEARSSEADKGKVNQSIAELNSSIIENGCTTLGQYYYKLISDHRNGLRLDERILERYTSRKMYLDELDFIINFQINNKSTFLTPEIAAELKKQVFYQRPLKSAKHLIGKCRLESTKRCMPKSHPIYQEFRAWTIINNLRWTNHDTGESEGLTLDQKNKAFTYFNTELKLTETKLKKILGISNRAKFNDVELKPCRTIIEMQTIFSESKIEISENQFKSIYHSLLFTQDSQFENFKNYLLSKYKISNEIADKLWKVHLEPDYGNISHKAALKLLHYMRQGMRYDEACLEAGYHHSFENKFKNYDKVRELKTNELRNPVVQKAIATCINLVNKIIDNYGKPDEVRIELARELKKPKSVRENIRFKNLNKQKQRDKYREILEKHFNRTIANSESLLTKYELWLELGCEELGLGGFDEFVKNSRKVDLEKYNLWLEADRISPYTGKVISLSRLMSPEIQIEHILPYSRTLDNSFMNKTLCESHFNANLKGKYTPMEYFSKRPQEEQNDFLKRIYLFSNPAKRDVFLADSLPDSFTNNQLTDTAYIAKLAIQRISQCIEKVYPTKGGATSIIRRELGLNSILHYGDDINVANDIKNRGDHRHHFIDAVVIAATTTAQLQQLSRANTINGKIDVDITAPWNSFRSDIEEKANSLLVVHKVNHKLTRKSINTYKHGSKATKNQELTAIRGSLHEDSLYGKIINSKTGEENYVIRKDLKSLDEKQLEKIIDEGIKRFLKAEIEKLGSWANVIKNPIIYNGKPLRNVRWQNNSKSLNLLRADTKSFIETGNNYLIAIYEDDNGKRDYESVSFYDAINKVISGKLVYPKSKQNKNLKYTVKILDKFIIYSESPEEINWTDFTSLNSRLYHLKKFTGSTVYISKSTIANEDSKVYKMPASKQSSVNTFSAIKIKLNLLGQIIWRSDIGKV